MVGGEGEGERGENISAGLQSQKNKYKKYN